MQRIWRNQQYGNVQEALDYLDDVDPDGSYKFSELDSLRKKYPNVFYPVYEMQQQIINNTLGELWWENHKAKLLEENAEMAKRELLLSKKKMKDEERALALAGDEMVIKRMGVWYYLTPWRIPEMRKRMLRIAAMEEDLDNNLLKLKDINTSSKKR